MKYFLQFIVIWCCNNSACCSLNLLQSNKLIHIRGVSLAISIVYFYWVGEFYIQFARHGSSFHVIAIHII